MFQFFKKKEKKAMLKPMLPEPKEFYPELPELSELKEPETLLLKPVSTESIRNAVENEAEKTELPELTLEEEPEIKQIKEMPMPKAERKVMEEHEAFEEPKTTPAFAISKPVFIEGPDFRKVSADLNRLIKSPGKIKKLATEEEKHFEEWYLNLEDVQRKLVLMDKTIFGG